MNNAWELWQKTYKEVYKATRDAWSRRVYVGIGQGECEICHQVTTIMDIDGSDGEYHSFECCRPCFEKLWEKA